MGMMKKKILILILIWVMDVGAELMKQKLKLQIEKIERLDRSMDRLLEVDDWRKLKLKLKEKNQKHLLLSEAVDLECPNLIPEFDDWK